MVSRCVDIISLNVPVPWRATRTISGKWSSSGNCRTCSATGCCIRPGVAPTSLRSESGGAANVSASKSLVLACDAGVRGCALALPDGGGSLNLSVPRGIGGFSASMEAGNDCHAAWRCIPSGGGFLSQALRDNPAALLPALGTAVTGCAAGLGCWYAMRISMGVSPSRWQQSLTRSLSTDVHSSTESLEPIAAPAVHTAPT